MHLCRERNICLLAELASLITGSDGVSSGKSEVVDDAWYLLSLQPSRCGELLDIAIVADLSRDLLIRA